MEQFNYSILFNKALQKIKNVRNPHAKRADQEDLKWNIVEKQAIFDFGGNELYAYNNIVNEANNISVSCLSAIIIYLAKIYEKDVKLIEERQLGKIDNPRFAIYEVQSKVLYIFRDIEVCNFWKADKESESIQIFMSEVGAKECKYIYLMYDYAYLQVIGHNESIDDPGRGTNVYSLMNFFNDYFGEEEKTRFASSLKEYLNDVNSYIGYIFVKSLTPNTLINFRKLTEHYILNIKFERLVNTSIKKCKMDGGDYLLLQSQFIEEKYYHIMLGDSDFAESIITAEWLYSSMKKAEAIDLTIIGMGYFKAIEQLLFELIKVNNKTKELGERDFTIGGIATYYKKNINSMFRDDIAYFTKTFVKEAIFEYSDLRNGYFHKHNIHDWRKIDEIREATFDLVFLVLGSRKLADEDKQFLGMPDSRLFDDYYRLCEYMNYHAGDVFFIGTGDREMICVACNDMNTKTVNNNYVEYSGVYIKVINEHGDKLVIDSKHLPDKIVLGKILPSGRNEVKMTPVRIKTIFEHGEFVGPSLVEEENLQY